jgi:hypothetical protein
MTTDEVLELLLRLERKLGTIADQAREAMEQARHTLDRANLLRRDVERAKEGLLAAADTAVLRSPLVEDV